MTRFATGYLPDPPGHKMIGFRHLKKRFAKGELPAEIDLSHRLPEVMDQNPTSGCVGHALAAGIYGMLGGWVPSPKGIYTLARCIDLPSPKYPLRDNGCAPSDAVLGVGEYGICPMGALPADGRYSDCDPETINEKPSFSDLIASAKRIILGTYRIDSFLRQDVVHDFCAALANGVLAACAVYASGAWQTNAPSAEVLEPESDDNDHYVLCYGYKTLLNGKIVFMFRNSWGRNWGRNGDCLVSEESLATTSDRYALTIKEAA